MTGRPGQKKDCLRLEQILLSEAAAELSLEDQAFKAAHLKECDECRTQVYAFDLMRFDGTSGAAEPIDDLRRRRLINGILEEAEDSGVDQPGEETPARAEPTGPTPAGWFARHYRTVAAAAVAACFAGGVLAFYLMRKTGEKSAYRKASTAAVPSGRILLRAGRAELDGSPVTIGQPVTRGQTLRVAEGRAAVRLPMGSMVLLSEKAVLQVEKLARGQVAVRLSAGELLASVTHRKAGQVFEVVTPHARFSVKGTIFSVRVHKDRAELKVFRGLVSAHRAGRAAVEVDRGNALALGGGADADAARVQRMDPKAMSASEGRIRLLGLLGRAEYASIHVRSRPTGATVLLDSTEVGLTPLAVAIQPGHRRLEVRLKPRTPVREFLELKPGDVVSRDLDLGSAVASATPPVAPEPPPEAAPPVRRRNGNGRGRAISNGKAAPNGGAKKEPAQNLARLLLIKAQRLRGAKDYRGAARTYRKLIYEYPKSPEARAALVSLGYVMLGPLRSARAALVLFNRYLKITRRGVLAQEATFGRARALRALGRKAEEIAALREFLKRYPRALQADQARRRLKALGQTPASPGVR